MFTLNTISASQSKPTTEREREVFALFQKVADASIKGDRDAIISLLAYPIGSYQQPRWIGASELDGVWLPATPWALLSREKMSEIQNFTIVSFDVYKYTIGEVWIVKGNHTLPATNSELHNQRWVIWKMEGRLTILDSDVFLNPDRFNLRYFEVKNKLARAEPTG